MGRQLMIITPAKPHLSVAKGLVEDRRQRVQVGRPVLTSRIARASYGVFHKTKYNPKIHLDEGLCPG
jgi:hypothetical protein